MAVKNYSDLRVDRRAAFTLVELLVVMAALVVLAAVTLPSIKGLMHDQKVTAAARMVKAHVESAQARAIATGRPVAVILERTVNPNVASSADQLNTVMRLSIGQVFPPYEGDVAGAVGTLSDLKGLDTNTKRYSTGVMDGFYDTITIPSAQATLLSTGVVDEGDFIQIGDRENTYAIESVKTDGANTEIRFINPPFFEDPNTGFHAKVREEQLTPKLNTAARFRVYRKPSKSFLQTTILPRGTCVDLTVSGMGQSGIEFSSSGTTAPIMIVFNAQGSISYLTDGSSNFPSIPSGIIHLLVGRTEQVSLASPMAVEDPDDTGTFNANINDSGNLWVSANPYTGAIYSSSMQAGGESGTLAARLSIARLFATNAITQSEN